MGMYKQSSNDSFDYADFATPRSAMNSARGPSQGMDDSSHSQYVFDFLLLACMYTLMHTPIGITTVHTVWTTQITHRAGLYRNTSIFHFFLPYR